MGLVRDATAATFKAPKCRLTRGFRPRQRAPHNAPSRAIRPGGGYQIAFMPKRLAKQMRVRATRSQDHCIDAVYHPILPNDDEIALGMAIIPARPFPFEGVVSIPRRNLFALPQNFQKRPHLRQRCSMATG